MAHPAREHAGRRTRHRCHRRCRPTGRSRRAGARRSGPARSARCRRPAPEVADVVRREEVGADLAEDHAEHDEAEHRGQRPGSPARAGRVQPLMASPMAATSTSSEKPLARSVGACRPSALVSGVLGRLASVISDPLVRGGGGEADVAAASGGDQLDDLGGAGLRLLDLGGYPAEVEAPRPGRRPPSRRSCCARSGRRRGPGRRGVGPGRAPAGSGRRRAPRSARRGTRPCCSTARPWRSPLSGVGHRRGSPPADAPTTRCGPTDSARVLRACRSISPSDRKARAVVISRPRNMFWVMSRLSASARSWYTNSMPRAVASRGSCRLTGLPSNTTSPLSIELMPAKHFTRVDLPAPLSPTRAVTSPG